MTEQQAKAAATEQGHRMGRFRRLGFSNVRYSQCERCGAVVDVAGDGQVSGDAITSACAGHCATVNRISTFQKPATLRRAA